MTEIFFGDWALRCNQLNWDWGQRFIISGSRKSDGIYPGIPGTEIAKVSGKRWSIQLEWNMGDGLGWQPSSTKRFPAYIPGEGLVIQIGCNNGNEVVRGTDYIDFVVDCKNLDESINPKPTGITYDFTIPQNRFRYPQ